MIHLEMMPLKTKRERAGEREMLNILNEIHQVVETLHCAHALRKRIVQKQVTRSQSRKITPSFTHHCTHFETKNMIVSILSHANPLSYAK